VHKQHAMSSWVLLIVLCLAALVYQGITDTSREYR
jgi:hypothetical protein